VLKALELSGNTNLAEEVKANLQAEGIHYTQ